MSGPKFHRGIELTRWATRTPYNQLTCFVDNPVMRISKTDHLYMTGDNTHLGCIVSLHFRKRSKQHDRPSEYILRYPFSQTVRMDQVRKVFHTMDEVELFLRPPTGDLSWIDSIDDETKQAISTVMSYALLDERRDLGPEEMAAISTLHHHVAPDSKTMSPARYAIPEDSRRIVWASSYGLLNSLDRLKILEEQTAFADAILEKLDLKPSPAMSI